MIGVNDILYRVVDPERAVDDATYRETLRRLIGSTRERLVCRITLMDPTPLEEDLTSRSHEAARRLADIVGEVAEEHDAERIRVYDALFSAMERAPRRGWMIDVPHPKLSGQAVIALAVLDHLGW